MKYLFFIAAFNAFFFTMLIRQKKNTLHDKILMVWLLYLGVYVGLYAWFDRVLFTSYHLLSAVFVSFLMLHGPLLYLYIKSLTQNKYSITGKDLLHFLPFVFFNLYLLAASFSPEIAGRIRLDHNIDHHETAVLFNFFLILTVLSGLVYFFLAVRLFKRLDVDISNNFSSSEEVDLDWLRKLTYSFGVVWTILMAIATIHHIFGFFSWSFCTDGLFLSLSVFIILIGYFGLRQKEVFAQNEEQSVVYVTEPKTKYANISLKETEADAYIGKLQRYMQAEKPYLNADLTLPELATEIHIPAHQLSMVINEKLGLNFFDFINQYRVEEVKSKISDPKFNHLTILSLALDSGFNTKSAFNRVFKNTTGVTPSEYKKKAQES